MTNVRTCALVGLVCSTGVPLACSGGGTVNIGDTTVIGSQLSDYAASWDGYAEAYTFQPSGSDRVRLTIDKNGQGTLQVGDGALLPPPTDPSVGYPPGADPSVAISELREGFLYPIYAAQVQTNRIQLGINPTDLFAQWCALQTSYPSSGASDAGTTYSCAPNWPNFETGAGDAGGGTCNLVNPDGGTDTIDCDKLILCFASWAVCSCTATSCTNIQVASGTPADRYTTELDGAMDKTGSTLTGTLVIDDGARVTVHLQKQ
jgi:hypothetical protein